jgi:hypothetical protein
VTKRVRTWLTANPLSYGHPISFVWQQTWSGSVVKLSIVRGRTVVTVKFKGEESPVRLAGDCDPCVSNMRLAGISLDQRGVFLIYTCQVLSPSAQLRTSKMTPMPTRCHSERGFIPGAIFAAILKLWRNVRRTPFTIYVLPDSKHPRLPSGV